MTSDVAVLGIKVDSSQAGQASRNLDQMAASAARAERAVDAMQSQVNSLLAPLKMLQGLLGGLAAALSIRELIQYADTWKLIEARLRLVTTSTQQLIAVQQKLFDIAQRTRTSYEATADLFTRVARNAGNLGKSQSELLRFTQALQQALQISGTTAQEASAVIVQLGQALASGVLRGDEFRALAENGGAAMDFLAKSLNTTIGGLRKMAEEGKLTADVVIGGLNRMAPEIDKQFAQIPITVGAAFTMLQNSFGKFINEVDKGNGVTSALANGISFLAKNIDAIASSALVAAAAIGTIYAGRAISAAIIGTQAWIAKNVALAASMQATTASARAATVAMAAWNQVLAFFGGPIGLAITAVTGAYLLLSSRQDAATKLTERYSQQLDEQAKAAKRAAIDVDALSEAERKRAQISNQAKVIDLEKQTKDARRSLTVKPGAEAGSAFNFLLGSGSMSAYSDATKAFKAFNDTGNLDAFRDSLIAIAEKQKALVPMVEEYLKKIDALKMAEKELADLRSASGKDVLDNLTEEDRARAKVKQTIEQLKDITKELYGDTEKTKTQIGTLQTVADAGADAFSRYGMSAEAARMGIAALQEAVSPAAAAIGDLNRQADLLGKADGYQRNLAKLMQDTEQKAKRPLTEEETTGLTQSFERERAAAMQDYISGLDERIAAERRLAAATASGNEVAAARARVDIQLADLAKQYGPEFDKNTTRTKLLEIEMAKLAGSTGNATAEMRLQTEAAERLAAAAGKGEAAMRAANRENDIAAAARKSASEASRLRVELEQREAQQIIQIRQEQTTSIQDQIRQQEALAAVIGRGQAAVQAVTINEKARSLALREVPEGLNDSIEAQEKFNQTLIDYVELLTKQQQLEANNALRGQIADRAADLKMIEAQVAGLQMEDGARAAMLQRLQDEIALKKLGIDLTGQLTEEQRRLADEYLNSGERLAKASKTLEEENKQIEAQKQIWGNMVKGIQDAFAGFFEDVLSTGKLTWSSLADSLKKVMISTISQIAAAMVFKPVIGEVLNTVGLGGVAKAAGLGSGSGTSGGGLSLSDLFGGGAPGGGSGGMFSGASNWLFGSAGGAPVYDAATGLAAGYNTAPTSGFIGSGGNVLGIEGFSPGTAFAGIGTALSAFNFIKNPSVGSGVGLVGSGLGLASALGAIGPAFGPIGMGLSIAAPLLGSLFGGNKVKHPGMGIEIMNGAEGLSLGKVSGKHMDTSGATPMGQAAIDAINATVKSMTGGTVGAGTGGQVYGLSYDGTVKKYRAVGEGLQEATQYETIGDAIKAVTVSALKNLPLEGVASNIATALKNSTADSLEGIKADIDFAKGFKDTMDLMKAGLDPLKSQAAEMATNAKNAATQWENFGVTFRQKAVDLGQGTAEEVNKALQAMMDGALGLTKASEPLTGYALAYEQAKANISALKDVLIEFGLTAEEAAAKIAAATEAARQALVKEQNTSLQQQITAATNPMQAEMDALAKWRDDQIAQAKAIGNSEGMNLIEQLFGIKQQEIVQKYADRIAGLTEAQVVAAQKAEEAARALREFNQNLVSRSLGVQQQDRRKALYDFDVAAAEQIRTAPKGSNMADLQAVLAGERAMLEFRGYQTDLMEAIDRQIRGINDQKSAIESQIAATQESIQAIKDMTEGLMRLQQDMKLDKGLSILSTGQRREESMARLDDLYARAMNGDVKAGQDYEAMARTFLSISRDYNASTPQYVADYKKVEGQINSLLGKTRTPLQVAELQLTELQNQSKQMDAQIAELQKQREEVSRLGERQLESMESLRTGMMAALASWQAAQQGLLAGLLGARGGAGGAAGGGAGGAAGGGAGGAAGGGAANGNSGGAVSASNDNSYLSGDAAYLAFADQAAKLTGVKNAFGVDRTSLGLQAAGFTSFEEFNTAYDAIANKMFEIANANGGYTTGANSNWREVAERIGRDIVAGNQLFAGTSPVAPPPLVTNGFSWGGLIPGYANGGVVGNGIWDQDSVLAKFAGGGHIALAGGEFVTTARAVNDNTFPMLDYINRTGSLPSASYASLPAPMDMTPMINLLSRAVQRLEMLIEVGKASGDLNAEGLIEIRDELAAGSARANKVALRKMAS